MRTDQCRKIALCGVLGALSLTVMLLGQVVPLADFCAPALAGILLAPIALEYDGRTAATLFTAVSLLCLLLPNPEMSGCFVAFFGYYPIIRPRVQRIRLRLARAAVKLLLFNGALAALYTLLLAVFALPQVVEEFSQTGRGLLLATVLMADLAFVVYDAALENLLRLYRLRLRGWLPGLRRMGRHF